MNAGSLLNPDQRERLINKDEAYRTLGNLQGSPHYMIDAKKHAFDSTAWNTYLVLDFDESRS